MKIIISKNLEKESFSRTLKLRNHLLGGLFEFIAVVFLERITKKTLIILPVILNHYSFKKILVTRTKLSYFLKN